MISQKHTSGQNVNTIFTLFCNGFDENNQLAYAFQGLSDFSNGRIFKAILEAKAFDGYIFRETDANTFCLFNPEKLSFPEVSLIQGEKPY